jgi:hypothetical protein
VSNYTDAQVRAALKMLQAVAEAIREVGSTPAGPMYAMLCGVMSLNDFNNIIDMLVKSKLVKRDGSHMLTWIGPAKPEAK